MNAYVKTVLFVVVAAVLAVTAFVAVPRRRTPVQFRDQGESFFKPFKTEGIGAFEVTDYDADQGKARWFRVEFKNGRWVIPSHHDYPADVREQMARMAALVVDLKKGPLRSEREADFEDLGVIDPTDSKPVGKEARGRRVSIRGLDGQVLADLIIGKEVQGRVGWYYVRQPDSTRTYQAKIDADAVSAHFSAWAETDVLRLDASQIDRVGFDHYRLQPDGGSVRVDQGDRFVIRQSADGQWGLEGGTPAHFTLDDEKVQGLVETLGKLELVNVVQKPLGMVKIIEYVQKGGEITPEIERALENVDKLLGGAGYLLTIDPATRLLRVYASDGDIRVACRDGTVYTLRLGRMVMADPDDTKGASPPASAAAATQPGAADRRREHRYLFVTVDFDPSILGPEPLEPLAPGATTRPATQPATQPASRIVVTTRPATQPATEDEVRARAEYKRQYDLYLTKLRQYRLRVEAGKKRREELAKRFDQWYYVISADAYAKLKLTRQELLRPVPATQPASQPATQPAIHPDMVFP